ncbi:MAG: hypothetical protein SGJ00_10325 [bacterium]|nr:hypothetical protein [bacterium]
MLNKQRYRFLIPSAVASFLLYGIFMSAPAFAKENENGFSLNLYGHLLSFEFVQPKITIQYPIEKEGVSKIVALVKESELQSLVKQMDSYSAEFGMDDMAYVIFGRKLSAQLYKDPNAAKLFQYQILMEKGYNVILGVNEEQLTLFGNLGFNILNGTTVQHQGLSYDDLSFDYNLEPCIDAVYEVAIGGRAILINENRPPFFNAIRGSYDLHTEFEGAVYFFKGSLNQSLANYYHDLPDIEFGQIYLNYQISSPTYSQLVGDLKKAISNMFPRKQIDFLLHFTQTAIPYKVDKEAIGKEKFAFPEEVLSNNYGDCEDKSVLFAYLTKEVLQLPSVALIYVSQNHLNVAVAINHASFNFIYNNQKYLICEPSGLGFAPGDNVYDLKKVSIIPW